MLKLKLQYFGHLMRIADSFEKTLMLGKIEGRWSREDRGWDAGWHHRLNGHGFVYTPGVGDGQGGLACCDSWGCKESDTTEWLNWTELSGSEWVSYCGLICISLMVNDVEHLFMYLLAIYISTLEKYRSKPLTHFKTELFVFLLLSCKSFFYIFWI